eukprot:CAMPEP_0182441734 /NCGR_PEP_ID=MMETSP1172-20130603/729_1 /TAXON_ID=708627 /ORGANISM="Timspurckia oligopyrenoides, Strain CCMP3278" /LENGTH=266 /DNA_ID=CAMNT_0024636227 /DNA_START=113 /DNA_END=913 /DNA_ORIENTATION=+
MDSTNGVPSNAGSSQEELGTTTSLGHVDTQRADTSISGRTAHAFHAVGDQLHHAGELVAPAFFSDPHKKMDPHTAERVEHQAELRAEHMTVYTDGEKFEPKNKLDGASAAVVNVVGAGLFHGSVPETEKDRAAAEARVKALDLSKHDDDKEVHDEVSKAERMANAQAGVHADILNVGDKTGVEGHHNKGWEKAGKKIIDTIIPAYSTGDPNKIHDGHEEHVDHLAENRAIGFNIETDMDKHEPGFVKKTLDKVVDPSHVIKHSNKK